jgi:hypothetical protein
VRLYLARHADAGVADADAGVIVRRHAREDFGEIGAGRNAGTESECTAFGHRIASVHAKVQENLVKLALVGGNERKFGGQLEIEVDRLREGCLQHGFEIAHERV